jgi:xanthine dehydrogenase YagR molybdenum-binding subunit
MTRPIVGTGIDRVDGRKKVTGGATYAAEVQVANVAYAVMVGATIARGRIKSIDTRAAEAVRGVLAVLTHQNAPKFPNIDKGEPNDRVVQGLQNDAVLYSDQPIAVVVADSLERAHHAAGLVTAEYDAEKPVADLEGDLASAYVPEVGNPRAPAQSNRGNVASGLASARTRLEATYTTPVETHNAMEPHATTAVWHGADRLTVYDSTQAIFNVRRRLSSMLGLAPENVRVINHFCGGGFGSKGAPWSHVVLAAIAAKATGRAVKLAVTRPQMQSLVGHRPKTVQKLELGLDARGLFTAIRHEVVSETSRFDQFVESCTGVTKMLYACPNLATVQRLVRIDAPTPTFTRAPGESTGTFALESALDELAYAAGLDPLELRRRNHADRDPENGKPWSSKSLLECYRRGAEKIEWSRRPPQIRTLRDGRWRIGLGVATTTRPSRQLPAGSRARMLPDGRAVVQAGTQEIGTGTYTIMTQIAADALALPLGDVRDPAVGRLVHRGEHRPGGPQRVRRAARQAHRAGDPRPGVAAQRPCRRRDRRRGWRAGGARGSQAPRRLRRDRQAVEAGRDRGRAPHRGECQSQCVLGQRLRRHLRPRPGRPGARRAATRPPGRRVRGGPRPQPEDRAQPADRRHGVGHRPGAPRALGPRRADRAHGHPRSHRLPRAGARRRARPRGRDGPRGGSARQRARRQGSGRAVDAGRGRGDRERGLPCDWHPRPRSADHARQAAASALDG